MTARWKRIKGLMDELITNSFKAGATVLESKIMDEDDKHIVYVKDNGKGMSEEKLEQAKKLLDQPRRDELEEYYGELAGRTAKNSGLSIVGMMVDEFEIKSEKGQGTEIKLIIYKED
ncbi:ATP-binding protein [Natranaerobius thermophilus]|uniref:ATP-binding region ATPase domain protein n=1 Tax=Natranaerobius thermophilus (strain ATCC BAA-1301 / DSM 18059 / JW/NM-WN-LF) TaxID=457570 RepID=B2A579_NATTJ|nr:ATP-binding protein [Natranaerobius thermophilus]ACB83913.1 ATP-binding region ATPase domain protein [Natranaerobius thermophilus JW/NM-WN-LF]